MNLFLQNHHFKGNFIFFCQEKKKKRNSFVNFCLMEVRADYIGAKDKKTSKWKRVYILYDKPGHTRLTKLDRGNLLRPDAMAIIRAHDDTNFKRIFEIHAVDAYDEDTGVITLSIRKYGSIKTIRCRIRSTFDPKTVADGIKIAIKDVKPYKHSDTFSNKHCPGLFDDSEYFRYEGAFILPNGKRQHVWTPPKNKIIMKAGMDTNVNIW